MCDNTKYKSNKGMQTNIQSHHIRFCDCILDTVWPDFVISLNQMTHYFVMDQTAKSCSKVIEKLEMCFQRFWTTVVFGPTDLNFSKFRATGQKSKFLQIIWKLCSYEFR